MEDPAKLSEWSPHHYSVNVSPSAFDFAYAIPFLLLELLSGGRIIEWLYPPLPDEQGCAAVQGWDNFRTESVWVVCALVSMQRRLSRGQGQFELSLVFL